MEHFGRIVVLLCLPLLVPCRRHVLRRMMSGSVEDLDLGEVMAVTEELSAASCAGRCRETQGCTASMLIGNKCQLYNQYQCQPSHFGCPFKLQKYALADSTNYQRSVWLGAAELSWGQRVSDAHKICHRCGAVPVAIESPDKQQVVEQFLAQNYSSCYVIFTGGRKDEKGNWHWVENGGQRPADFTQYSNFAEGEPNVSLEKSLVLIQLPDAMGKWYDHPDITLLLELHCVLCEFRLH